MLNGYKTYLAAIAAILIALGVGIQEYGNGSPIEFNLIIEALIALAMIFLRQGIKEKKVN
jgi:hypothetical protein